MNLRPVPLAIPPLKRIEEEIPAPSPVLVRGDEAFLNRRGRNLIKMNWHRGEVAWAIDLPFPPRLPAQSPRALSLSAQGTAIVSSLGLAVCVYEANTTTYVAAVELASGTIRWTREFSPTDLFTTPNPEVLAKARAESSAAHSDRQPSTMGDPYWNNHVRPMEIDDAPLLHIQSSLNDSGVSLHPQTGEPGSSALFLALDPLTGATSGRLDVPCTSTGGRAIITASGVSVWNSQLAELLPRFGKPPKSQLGEPLCRDTHTIVPIRTGNAWGVVFVPFDSIAAPVVHLFPANPSPRSVMDRLVPLSDDILLTDGFQNIALLNAEGRLRWTAKTPPYVYSIAALPQGPIAVGTAGAGGSLFVLDRSTGHTLFKHPFPTPSVAAVTDRGGFLASSFLASDPQTLFVRPSSRGECSSIHPLSTHVHTIHAIQGHRILHSHESLRVADLVD